MNRKNGIDVFRLIGAFCIMCLHVGDYGSLNQECVDNIRLLSRWAVPFFFIASGFFLGHKIEHNKLDFSRVQKNVSTLITILIVSSIIFLPIAFKEDTLPQSIGNLLTGTYSHLWFIGSLLMGYIFIWYIFYIEKSKALPYISIGIILLTLFADSYDQLFHESISIDLPRFLLSVPFMYIGIFLSKNESNTISNKILIGLILLGFAIQCIEAEMFLKWFHYEKYTHQFLIGTIVVAIPLFIWSSRINIKENVFSKWGRDYALFIYLYHPIIYIIMTVILNRIVSHYVDCIKIFSPLIGFTLILSCAIVLNKWFPRIYAILNGKL